MLVTSAAVGFSLFLVLTLFIYLNSENEWSKLNARLTIQAEIIAMNSLPAVVFDDPYAAEEILAALKADETINHAKIITADHSVIARYENPNIIKYNQLHFVIKAIAKWLRMGIVIDHDIFQNDNKIGRVQITASLVDLYRNNLKYVSLAFLISLISMLLTLFLSNSLLKRVVDPIIKLTRIARKVTNLNNYTVRAEIVSKDEVGELTRTFNEMLKEIQRKDLVLEKTVAERTSELIQLNKKLKHQAYHDSLTGLANRMLFDDRLQVVLTHAHRFDCKVAVMCFDLDHFKVINDTLGHDTGDKLLIEVSKRMRTVIRQEDTLCRVGGDEFTLILNNIDSTSDVELVAEKMLTAFSKPFQCNEHELSVSSSIGVSLYPENSVTKEQLIRFADIAMYHAKHSGRNNYCFFSNKMDSEKAQSIDKKVLFKHNLKTAIDTDEIQIYYQPQVNMQGRIVAVEALLRWKNAENQMISPEIFIPMAEESGLIHGLEEWAFAEICQQYAKWRSAGFSELSISINISGYRLRQQDFNYFIEETLNKFALPTSFLIFEIAENELMQNMTEMEKVLNRLHSKGIKIAVDKFGSGYTSLNYLQQLPIDQFKIDAEFIRHLGSHYDGATVIQAIISLANSLNKSVVAMGVENQDQVLYLQNLNCHAMQGYLFAKPLAEEEINRLFSGSLNLLPHF